MKKLLKFLKEEEGLELVEYALMGALFAIALMVSIGWMQDAVEATFNAIATAMP